MGYGWYYGLSRRLTPGLRPAGEAYNRVVLEHVTPGCRWLDLGCGRLPLRSATPAELDQLRRAAGFSVGIDCGGEHLRQNRTLQHLALADAAALPFADGSFDVVTANMVAEHLTDPGRVLGEVARVLRPGGRLLFHTPHRGSLMVRLATLAPGALRLRLAALLEGRPASSIFPTCYRLNDRRTITRLAADAGLVVRDVQLIEDVPVTKSLGPAVAAELLWIRLTRSPLLAGCRDNLVAVLERPSEAAALRRAA